MKRRITLLSFGLATVSLPVSSQNTPTEMEKELIALLNTKVEVASKKAESTSDAPGIISVLTRDELERFGAMTLADVLNRVPGLINVGSYMSDRSIMAAPGDTLSITTGSLRTSVHVLVLIDGRPLREVQEGGIKNDFYESFPVSAVDHIEVIKGPGSVLYGSEAFHGVINVVTLRPEKTRGSVAAALGENGAYQHSGTLEIVDGDFNVMASAQRSQTPDWPVDFWFNLDKGGPSLAKAPINMAQKKEGSTVRATCKNFSLAGTFLKLDTPHMVPDYGPFPDNAPGNQLPGLAVAGHTLKKELVDLGYNFEINKDWNITTNFTYNHSIFDVYEIQPYFRVPNIIRDSNEKLGEVTSFLSITPNLRWIAGGLFSRATGTERDHAGNPPGCVGTRDSKAIYSQLDYTYKDFVKFIGGFQALKVGDGESKVVPRLGVILKPTEKIHIKALYGEAFRAPYINENFNNLFIGFWVKGNRDLKPELVKNLQVGISYVGSRGEAQISAFESRQSDIIGFLVIPDGLQYANQDSKIGVRGVELEGKYYLNKEFLVVGSILAQKPFEKYTSPFTGAVGDQYTGYSNFGAKLGISYQSRYGSASLFNVHQGSVSETLYNPLSNNPKPGAYDLLHFYGKLDINKTFDLHSRSKAEFFLQGDNLLKKDLWIPAISDATPASIPFRKGRVWHAGLKVSF